MVATFGQLIVFPNFLRQDGYLYEKQAILEYILHQKTDAAKRMKVQALFFELLLTVELKFN